MRGGRPLRFLTMVLGGWIGLRVLVLWPAGDFPITAPRVVGRAVAKPIRFPAASTTTGAEAEPVPPARMPDSGMSIPMMRDQPTIGADAPTWPTVAASAVSAARPIGAIPEAPAEEPILIPRAAPDRAEPGRWGGSVWAIARPSGPAGGLGSSQLGGSQAGARLTYALGATRRVALVARVATPLEGRGREAAAGVELRVPGVPIRLFAEQRFALDDRARGGPSVGAIAGVDRTLGAGFRLEAYGQAGAIERDGLEGFADGAARVTRALVGGAGTAVDVGAGAWAGAQRGAERLDVGPTVGVSWPVGGRRIRATLDYRIRVAGRSLPGSGPALSLGTDL